MMQGWVSIKEGALKSLVVSPDKRDMLISYDLISLSGLDKCEDRLNARGVSIVPALVSVEVEVSNADCYGTTYRGKLNQEMLSYTTNKKDELDTLIAVAGFMYNHSEDISVDENAILGRFWLNYRTFTKDGRRKTTNLKLLSAVRAICTRLNVCVVPISISF